MIVNKKNIAKLLVVSTLLGGCANQVNKLPGFTSDGDKFFESKNYLKAIEFYQKGLQKDPEDKELQSKLENSKKLYVEMKVAVLEQKLQSNRHTMMLIDTLQTDLASLDKFGSFQANNGFRNKLNNIKRSLSDQIAQLKKQILDYSENKEYQKLLAKFESITAIDTSFKSSDFYITYFNEALSYYFNETVKSLNQGDLMKAKRDFLAYKTYSDDQNKLNDLSVQIKEFEKVDTIINTVQSSLDQENMEDALKNSLELITMKIKNKVLRKRSMQVTAKVTKEFLTRAQRSYDNGDIAQAYYELSDASKIKSSAKFTSIGTVILGKIYDKAREYSNMELDAVAYSLYDYIKKIDSNFKSIFVLQRDIKDRLKKRNLLQLAISEFVTPNLNRNAGTRFTASLTSQLFKNSKSDLKVIERNRLKLILDELKLQETGNVDTLMQQRGKIKGIDIFVFGDIVESSIDPQRVETRVSKKVEIGKRKVSNPMFMLYLSKPAEERASMKMPDQFIEEPEYQIISYTKGSITKTANLIVSVRIVNIQKGEIIDAKTFEKQKIESDKYNEGVEFAGIVSDPENIPSDKVLMTNLQKELINEISTFVLNTFDSREMKAVERSSLLVERREYAKAMEELINSKIISEIKKLPITKEVLDQEAQLFKELVQ
jgi:curli biogenesis system outer membrane secretion channel CsgG